jgi:hypothetical protein
MILQQHEHQLVSTSNDLIFLLLRLSVGSGIEDVVRGEAGFAENFPRGVAVARVHIQRRRPRVSGKPSTQFAMNPPREAFPTIPRVPFASRASTRSPVTHLMSIASS